MQENSLHNQLSLSIIYQQQAKLKPLFSSGIQLAFCYVKRYYGPMDEIMSNPAIWISPDFCHLPKFESDIQ